MCGCMEIGSAVDEFSVDTCKMLGEEIIVLAALGNLGDAGLKVGEISGAHKIVHVRDGNPQRMVYFGRG
jgi:hypothetical protein